MGNDKPSIESVAAAAPDDAGSTLKAVRPVRYTSGITHTLGVIGGILARLFEILVVGDYVWLRPYIGGGASLQRATQAGFGSTSETGFQAFGGGEFTFASAPRLAVSTDLGYRWTHAPYDGFELGGLRVGLSAHWYLK